MTIRCDNKITDIKAFFMGTQYILDLTQTLLYAIIYYYKGLREISLYYE